MLIYVVCIAKSFLIQTMKLKKQKAAAAKTAKPKLFHVPQINNLLAAKQVKKNQKLAAATDLAYQQNNLGALTQAAGSTAFLKTIDPNYEVGRVLSLSVDGVYYRGKTTFAGHFISVHNGKEYNSYNEQQQVPGSNGFCQTFSAMNFLNGITPDQRKWSKRDWTYKAAEFLLQHAAGLKKPLRTAALEQAKDGHHTDITLTHSLSESETRMIIQELIDNPNLFALIQNEHLYVMK